jgi:hypothetical protein
VVLERSDLDHMMGDTWARQIPPSCPRCGYNLTGRSSNRCPECGQVYQRRVVDEFAFELQTRMRRLGNMNNLVRMGFKTALVGAGALGLGILRANHTPSLDEAGRAVAIICGVMALSLGGNVFRARRLPVWAIEYLPTAPNFNLGLLTSLFGGLLIALSIAIP